MEPYKNSAAPAKIEDDEPGLYDDNCWYLASARGVKAGPRLVALCRELAEEQETLRANTNKCMAVYQWGGEALMTEPDDDFPIEENVVAFNAAKNTIETVHSKVIKPTITPMPLTQGGGYLARHRAKQMQKAIEGVLDDNEFEDVDNDMVFDALVTDHASGACIVYDDPQCNEVRVEHIPVEDIWYDKAETRRRKPRCMYYVPRDGVDMYVMIEQYANPVNDGEPGWVGTAEERRRAIIRAAGKPESWRGTKSKTKRVDYFEGWHLPSGSVEEIEEEYDEEYEDEETGETRTRAATRKVKRHDGRHVIAVSGEDGTLYEEPWCEDHFPVVLYTPRKRRRNIWGLSLMRDLIAPQREYEKLTRKIQTQHQKMGMSGILAPKTAELNPKEFKVGTDVAGWIAEYDGTTPPTVITPEPVAEGTYGYKESLPRDMLERNGISTLSAASQVPAGLQQASGKALQVFEDFEDTRLMPYHRERQLVRIKIAWRIVCAAKRIVDRGVSYQARYRGKRGLEAIDWAEVLKDYKDFVIRVFPVSALSKQPAAKFAQLTELLNAQAITVEQFKRLFELPDLEAENELDSAHTDLIDRNMDIMITTGRYISPEPFDLPQAEMIKDRVARFIQVCRQYEVPEERRKLLHDYLEDLKTLEEQAAAAMPPAMPPGMPPMGPGGMPMGPEGMMPPEGPLPGMPPAVPPMQVAA